MDNENNEENKIAAITVYTIVVINDQLSLSIKDKTP